jgi:putative nucleotidyltransferase with HDIG domain
MLLLEVSKSLISEIDLHGLLSHTVDTLVRKMKTDMVSFMLLDEETQETSIRVSHGFPREMLDTARWVVQRKEPLLLPNVVHAEPQIQSELSENGIGSALSLPLLVKGKVIGVLTLANLVGKETFSPGDLEIASMLCNQLAIAIENIKLFDKLTTHKRELELICKELEEQTTALNGKKRQLENAYLEIAKTMALILEARDPYTRGHSERVAQFARQIALQMNLPREERDVIDIAARLHDIGKLAISNEILLKPGALTPSERAEIQRHPTKAVEMLRFLDFLKDALPIIEHHHERYDGKGYPRGLKGEEIPLGARILAVVDAYDALTSERAYRPAMSNEQAIVTLRQGAGTQWDPIVVEAFLSALQ